jgi:hypothetical protein
MVFLKKITINATIKKISVNLLFFFHPLHNEITFFVWVRRAATGVRDINQALNTAFSASAHLAQVAGGVLANLTEKLSGTKGKKTGNQQEG